MKVEHEPIEFQNTISPVGGYSRIVSLIISATPSVYGIEFLQNDGTVRTVTNFTDGQLTQELRILGDGNLTIANNTFIKTNTGANKLLAANKVYRFTFYDPLWVEDA